MKPTERSLPEPEWTPAQIAKGLRDATEHKNQVVIVKSAALQIAKWLEFLPANRGREIVNKAWRKIVEEHGPSNDEERAIMRAMDAAFAEAVFDECYDEWGLEGGRRKQVDLDAFEWGE